MNHPHIITTFMNIGDLWQEIGNTLIAREYFKHAFKISKAIYEPNHMVRDMLKERLEKAVSELEDNELI